MNFQHAFFDELEKLALMPPTAHAIAVTKQPAPVSGSSQFNQIAALRAKRLAVVKPKELGKAASLIKEAIRVTYAKTSGYGGTNVPKGASLLRAAKGERLGAPLKLSGTSEAGVTPTALNSFKNRRAGSRANPESTVEADLVKHYQEQAKPKIDLTKLDFRNPRTRWLS